MKPERWKKIEDLYHAAQSQPVGQRAEFLQRAHPDDAELRAEVESLLKVAGEENSFLEGSPIGSIAERAPALKPGDKLGSFQIVSSIGRGGIGEVWEARHTPLGRHSAIKISTAQFGPRL